MKINLLPPALIFYTDNIDPTFGGMSYGPVILIRPKYEKDQGLHAHELEHAKQFWLGLGVFHGLLYWLSKRYRMWAEVEAYRSQMKQPPYLSLEQAATLLVRLEYNLNITFEQALAALCL